MKRKVSLLLLSIVFALSFFACGGGNKPPKTNTNGDPDLVLTSLTVFEKTPADLKSPSFMFGRDKKTVTHENVVAKFSYGTVKDERIHVTVEGGTLQEGSNALTLKIDAVPGKHKAWILPIYITIQDVPTLRLRSLSIFSVPVKTVSTAPAISLPKDKTAITAGDIVAKFDYGREQDKEIAVVVANAESLQTGVNTIKLSVPEKTDTYKAWGPQDVTVTLMNDNSALLTLTSLKIHDMNIENLQMPSLTVESAITSVDSSNVEAKFNYGTQSNVKIDVTVENGEELEGGQNVIILNVAEKANEYVAWRKEVVIMRNAVAQNLTLSSLSIHKVSCTNVPASPVCEIPQHKAFIAPGDVVAQFDYGNRKNVHLEVQVLNGAGLKLGENVINLRVPAKENRYNEWTGSVKVIRKETAVDLVLDSLFIHGQEVINKKVSFEHKHKTVTAGDVKATFALKTGVKKVIPVEVRNCPAELQVGQATKIKLFVPESKDEYKEQEIEVEVTRNGLPAKVSSSITKFEFEGVDTKLDQITADKIFDSVTLKPVVRLETDRMFEKIESAEFAAAEYETNHKTAATLTLKDALVKDAEKTVTIKVTTKTPNAEQEDEERTLTFKIKLKNGTVTISKIESENVEITQANETLIVTTKKTVNVTAYMTLDGATGLTATLKENGTATSYEGTLQGTLFTFKNVVLTEADKTFTLTVKGANITDVTFTFKAKYQQPVTDRVVIEKVEVNDVAVTENANVDVTKANGTVVKVYLAKNASYEETSVTVKGNAATQPHSGNNKLFQAIINGLVQDAQTEITVVANAKNKTSAEFKFNLTFKKPQVTKLVSVIAAKGNGDSRFWHFESATDGSLEVTVGGDSLSGGGDTLDAIQVTLADDLNGKDASKLSVKVTEGGSAKTATFQQDASSNNQWIATLDYSGTVDLSSTYKTFTLELLENNVALETYTLKIKI